MRRCIRRYAIRVVACLLIGIRHSARALSAIEPETDAPEVCISDNAGEFVLAVEGVRERFEPTVIFAVGIFMPVGEAVPLIGIALVMSLLVVVLHTLRDDDPVLGLVAGYRPPESVILKVVCPYLRAEARISLLNHVSEVVVYICEILAGIRHGLSYHAVKAVICILIRGHALRIVSVGHIRKIVRSSIV